MRKKRDEGLDTGSDESDRMIAFPAGLIAILAALVLTAVVIAKAQLNLLWAVPLFSLIGAAIFVALVLGLYLLRRD